MGEIGPGRYTRITIEFVDVETGVTLRLEAPKARDVVLDTQPFYNEYNLIDPMPVHVAERAEAIDFTLTFQACPDPKLDPYANIYTFTNVTATKAESEH